MRRTMGPRDPSASGTNRRASLAQGCAGEPDDLSKHNPLGVIPATRGTSPGVRSTCQSLGCAPTLWTDRSWPKARAIIVAFCAEAASVGTSVECPGSRRDPERCAPNPPHRDAELVVYRRGVRASGLPRSPINRPLKGIWNVVSPGVNLPSADGTAEWFDELQQSKAETYAPTARRLD